MKVSLLGRGNGAKSGVGVQNVEKGIQWGFLWGRGFYEFHSFTQPYSRKIAKMKRPTASESSQEKKSLRIETTQEEKVRSSLLASLRDAKERETQLAQERERERE
jgi:hypothetical protein